MHVASMKTLVKYGITSNIKTTNFFYSFDKSADLDCVHNIDIHLFYKNYSSKIDFSIANNAKFLKIILKVSK